MTPSNQSIRQLQDTIHALRDRVTELELKGCDHDLLKKKMEKNERGIRELFEITSDLNVVFQDKLSLLLKMGCQRFNLPLGLCTRLEGGLLYFQATYSEQPDLVVGDHIPLEKTYCYEILKANAPISFEHARQSGWDTHAGYPALQLEAYLGAPILMGEQPFGTLVFASQTPYPGVFTDADKDFIQLMARWMGSELERQKAGETLRLLQFSVDNAPEAMFTINAQGRIVAGNQIACERLEYSMDELLTISISDIDQNFSPERWAAHWVEIKSAGHLLFESTHKAKNGRKFPVEVLTQYVTFHGQEYACKFIRDITDRKVQEEEKWQNMTFLNSIVENIPNMIFVKEAKELKFIQLNKAGERLLGYSRDELLNRNDYDFFPEGEAKFFIEKDQEVLASQTLVDIPEEPILTRHNGTRILHTKKIPILDEKHQPQFLLGISEDITERKMQETLLRSIHQAESQFLATNEPSVTFDGLLQALLSMTESEYGFIGEVLHSQNGNPYLKTHAITNIAWTPELRDMFDRMAPNLEFHNLATLFGSVITTAKPVIANEPGYDSRSGGLPEGHPPLNCFLGLPFFSGQELVGMVGIANRPGGYDEKLVYFLDPFLTSCGTLINAFRNYQRRQQAEADLRVNMAELRRYEQIVSASKDCLSLIDQHYRYQAVNQEYSKVFGLAPGNLFNVHVRDLIGEDSFERDFKPYLDRCLAGEAVTIQHWMEFPDQTRRFMDNHFFPFVNSEGKIGGTVNNMRDITQQKNLEEQVRQGQKLEAVGTLAAGIAHDFNNILMVMQGNTLIASQQPHRTEMVKESLEEVLKAGRRAKKLIEQILTFSRHDEPVQHPVIFQEVIQESLTLLRASLPSTIEIQSTLEKGKGTVLADVTQIHQIMINLGANAEHAMREVGGELFVELEDVEVNQEFAAAHLEIQPGPYIRLTVRDTGRGIPPKALPRIFDPFFTTKQVGEGTGLGLAVVHGIISSHRGAITVTSQLGQGTAFSFYFPQIEDSVFRKVPSEPPEPFSCVKGKILFIDDEEALVRLGSKVLEMKGLDVVGFTHPEEAIEAFRASPKSFAAVITDQTMPKITGEGVRAAIHEIRPEIPIILLTGFSRTIDKEKAKALGFHSFFMKPVTPGKLVTAIVEALRKQGETT
jgi:PAS domain S-box-containing protein